MAIWAQGLDTPIAEIPFSALGGGTSPPLAMDPNPSKLAGIAGLDDVVLWVGMVPEVWQGLKDKMGNFRFVHYCRMQ